MTTVPVTCGACGAQTFVGPRALLVRCGSCGARIEIRPEDEDEQGT